MGSPSKTDSTEPASSLSTRSGISVNSATSRHVSVHGHLTRSIHRRDPMDYYEVVSILGEGSMGSVSKVKKRTDTIGGSSRLDYVQREAQKKLEALREENFCAFVLQRFLLPLQDCWRKNVERKRPSILISQRSVLDRTCSNISSASASRHRTVYALKSIHLGQISDPGFLLEMENEINILQQMDHPNIVKAMETFEHQHHLFVILELCDGGDLYSRDPYTEKNACAIVQQITSAVAYMHAKQVSHRDLKFENIMFADEHSMDIKIIDFGLSKKYGSEKLHDTVGTIYSMAPEVLKGQYTEQADIWSIGVLAFMLLSSSMPFFGKTRKHVMKKVLKADYDFKGRRWRFVSPSAKQFVQTLIQIDPKRRPTAHEALEMPWLCNQLVFSQRGTALPNMALRDHVQATIQTFAEYGTLKKLALLVIAFRSSSEEVGFLKEYFNKFDTLKQGELNLEEFKDALSDYDYTEKEVENLFNAIDLDQTGLIHYSEFLAATIEANGDIDEERLAEAFDRLDSDSDGYITVENLHEFLGDEIPPEYLDAIIDEAALTREHRISYEEFLAMFYNDDTDSRKEKALAHVEERRHHHEEMVRQETMSTISSGSDMCHDELEDLPEICTATHHFRAQKEKSIRNAVWI